MEVAFNFEEWAKNIGLRPETVDLLKRQDLVTQDVLILLTDDNIRSLGLVTGQGIKLQQGINQLSPTSDEKQQEGYRPKWPKAMDPKDARMEMAREFQKAADELDEHYGNVRVARIVGGSAGVVGSGVSTVAAVLAPFTAGVSVLAAAGIGIGVAVAGGLTSVGSAATGYFIRNQKMKSMDEKWKAFRRNYLQQLGFPEEVPSTKSGDTSKHVGKLFEVFKAGTVAVVKTGAKDACPKMAQVVSAAAAFAGIITIGVNVYDIFDAANDLRTKKKCPGGTLLRFIANELERLDEANGEEIVRLFNALNLKYPKPKTS